MRSELKTNGKSIIIVLVLIFGIVNESWGQIFKTKQYRKLEAKYRELKKEHEDCIYENKEMKEKNDSLINNTKIVTMKSESLQAFEAEIRPEIPGGYIYAPINSTVMSTMNILGDVETYIEKKLYDAGFTNAKRFEVYGGFGIASDIEKIKNDWTSEDSMKRFDLSFDYSKAEGNWLKRLFYPRSAGKTRMFLFIVSNQSFNAKGSKLDLYEILDWMEYGHSSLRKSIANIKLDDSYKMHVLVYEYEVIEGTPEGKLNKSGITAIDHLKKAKLWKQEMGL